MHRPSTPIALGLSLIAGLGHVYLGRRAQGVILFGLFAAAANGLLIGSVFRGPEAPTILRASQVAIVTVWTLAFAGTLRLTVFTDRGSLAECRHARLREGLALSLRGEHEAAFRAFEAARRCDIDRHDPDALFLLAVSRARLGDRKGAERLFARCLAADVDGLYGAEVDRERARLQAGGRGHHG